MSLISDLERFFCKHPEQWHHKGTLQRVEWKDRKGKRYEADNISRRLRDLEQAHIIAVRYDKSLTAEYRYIPHAWRGRYIDAKARGPYRNEPMWRSEELKTLAML